MRNADYRSVDPVVSIRNRNSMENVVNQTAANDDNSHSSENGPIKTLGLVVAGAGLAALSLIPLERMSYIDGNQTQALTPSYFEGVVTDGENHFRQLTEADLAKEVYNFCQNPSMENLTDRLKIYFDLKDQNLQTSNNKILKKCLENTFV